MPQPQIQIVACFVIPIVWLAGCLIACMIAFGDWKTYHTRLAVNIVKAAFCMGTVAVTSQSQSQPAWAQQQAQDLREVRRQMDALKDVARNNTKDIGYLEKELEDIETENAKSHLDYENRLREVETNIVRVLAGCAVLAFIAPGIFHLIITRRNGRNGTNGGHGK